MGRYKGRGAFLRNVAGSLRVVYENVPKRYFAVMIYELPTDNARQLLGIIVPALIVDCLTAGGTVSRVLALAGVYAGIVVVLSIYRNLVIL